MLVVTDEVEAEKFTAVRCHAGRAGSKFLQVALTTLPLQLNQWSHRAYSLDKDVDHAFLLTLGLPKWARPSISMF